MASIDIDGARLHVRQLGDGPDVVLLHGLGANMAFWPLDLVRRLGARFRVTLVDLRGHGHSTQTPQGYRASDLARDAEAVAVALGLGAAHVVGHSFGGLVALRWALARPERVRSLVFADARVPRLQPSVRPADFPFWDLWWSRFQALGIELPEGQELDFTILALLADPRWESVRGRLAQEGLFVPFGGWNAGRRGAARWRRLLAETAAAAEFRADPGPAGDEIARLGCPVLAVYGELSHCLGTYEALRTLLPGAAAAISPGAGHFHPAVKPGFFADALDRFLTAHERPTAAPREGDTMTKRILLVSPLADNEKLWVTGDEELCGDAMNNFVPLGLATVAALTPPGLAVDIWDELVHGKLDDPAVALPQRYDLVGITGYKAHLPRCRQIAAVFRAQGIPVAIGGPGVSASPDEYRAHFDVLFVGEAEETWPRFLADWAAGTEKNEYRQIEKIDLARSPKPRWDGLERDLGKYAFGGVQTTRGCPFDCEFCDVIYLYGRRARHKPIPQVLDEVRTLERLGMRNVFFSDDEFIGDRKYTKDLLRELVELNASFARPLTFSTQLTMNLSRDEEMLALMADANFDLVFIGIETPNKESLRETHKIQNIRDDLVADVQKILSYGISIRAGIIVGFDHDDAGIFDTVLEFIQDSYLPSLAINMLKAPLGTRLWSRLRLEGRVVSVTAFAGKAHPRTYTNILPKRMTRAQLVEGYGRLLEGVMAWPAFAHRVKGFVSLCRRPPRVREEPMSAEEAGRLPAQLDITPEGRETIADIVAYTQRHAPFMLRRVKRLVVQHAAYHATLARLRPQIARQVELERDEGLTLAPDDRAIPLPPAFRDAFHKLFPDVHRRVWLNMRDKAQVPEALTEVFVDFLVRWGDDFRGFEPHHRAFLAELCDRTCARLNGDAPERFVPIEDEAAVVPDVKRIRLGDDVLRSVDQELLRFVQAKQAEARP